MNGESVKIQEPGEDIKPRVHQSEINRLMNELYGLQVTSVKEMDSYDDKNYHVITTMTSQNPFIPEVCEHGYTLKVMNSMESQRPRGTEAQIELLHYMKERGSNVPETVKSVDGKDLSLEYIYADEARKNRSKEPHIVRLLKFIPGDIVHSKPLVPKTIYNIGLFLGKFQKDIRSFRNDHYDKFTHLWSLLEFEKLKDFIFVIKDEDDKCVVQGVMDEFCKNVVPNLHKIEKGLVHGDINEQNVLLKVVPGQEDVPEVERVYDVSGILDFADVAYSYCVFDIAICIAYMSLWVKDEEQLDIGGHILAGALSTISFNDTEFSMLRVLVCARLCQSVVMGAYTNYQDPTNTYVLTTSARGWPLLHKLWKTPNDVLLNRWRTIIKSYQ